MSDENSVCWISLRHNTLSDGDVKICDVCQTTVPDTVMGNRGLEGACWLVSGTDGVNLMCTSLTVSQSHCVTLALGLGRTQPGARCVPLSLCNPDPKP